MTSLLPEDPYKALGVASDATAAAIKTAYRKLVLKHHPDKVTDDSLKQAAADQFHKIQTAWETVGDEDKRTRYDAQCRLAALRREVIDREGHPAQRRSDPRSSAGYRGSAEHRSPTTPSRGYSDYRVEEIRPQDAEYDRAKAERREFDLHHDRPRRTPPKDDKHRSKVTRENSKESEKARQREKVRMTTKATNRERDYKYSSYAAPGVESEDSDYYKPQRRSPVRESDEARRREDRYFEHNRREQEAATADRYYDETSRLAKAYIERSRRYAEPPRRPSPNRMSSSREQIEIMKQRDGRPAAVRRGSGRSRAAARDDAEVPRRRRDDERDMRSSGEHEEMFRRPPILNQTYSAPDGIRLPNMDKPRSYSVQHDTDDFKPAPPRRTESMPQQASSRREEPRGKSGRSGLRQSSVQDDYDARKAPSQSYPGFSSRKEQDDYNDSFHVEVREPVPSRKYTRSPSPMREQERERTRGSSNRHASPQVPPLNTRTTSYVYSPSSAGVEPVSRPKLGREGSSRKDMLYGEVRPPREPMSAPPDSVRFQEVRPDVRVQSGYSTGRRTSDGRSPSYYRSPNYPNPVSA